MDKSTELPYKNIKKKVIRLYKNIFLQCYINNHITKQFGKCTDSIGKFYGYYMLNIKIITHRIACNPQIFEAENRI